MCVWCTVQVVVYTRVMVVYSGVVAAVYSGVVVVHSGVVVVVYNIWYTITIWCSARGLMVVYDALGADWARGGSCLVSL